MNVFRAFVEGRLPACGTFSIPVYDITGRYMGCYVDTHCDQSRQTAH